MKEHQIQEDPSTHDMSPMTVPPLKNIKGKKLRVSNINKDSNTYLLNIDVQIREFMNPFQNKVTAILDTGANCSCVNEEIGTKLRKEYDFFPIQESKVSEASGRSLGATGFIYVPLEINGRKFTYYFIVCKRLKARILLGLDFAHNFRIGMDWGTDGNPYL